MGIKIGSPAPEAVVDYWIRGVHGPRRMTLAEHRGKWVVLFFYPQDFTFICPTELVAFGELEADFKAELDDAVANLDRHFGELKRAKAAVPSGRWMSVRAGKGRVRKIS